MFKLLSIAQYSCRVTRKYIWFSVWAHPRKPICHLPVIYLWTAHKLLWTVPAIICIHTEFDKSPERCFATTATKKETELLQILCKILYKIKAFEELKACLRLFHSYSSNSHTQKKKNQLASWFLLTFNRQGEVWIFRKRNLNSLHPAFQNTMVFPIYWTGNIISWAFKQQLA